MKGLLEAIARYDNVRLTIFFEEVFFKSDSALKGFLFMELKDAPAKQREAFLERISTSQAKFMREQIEKQQPLERDEFAASEKRMQEIVDNMENFYADAVQDNQKGSSLAREYRNLLKASEKYHFSDQNLGKPFPPAFKSFAKDTETIELPEPSASVISKGDIFELVSGRRSRRKFTEENISLEELGWLLWATQGVRKVVQDGRAVFRTVPSGGARHPFETYLFINRVEGIKPGIYHYLSNEHKLGLIKEFSDTKQISEIAHGQTFAGECAVCFFWVAVPYRTEWRYINHAKKDILIEAGHICQNLYLSSEAIGCGTCGIAAYDQDKLDRLLELDGEDEFVIYIAPAGKIKEI